MAGNESLRVFISYARRDCSAFAEELKTGLQVAGFDAFLDTHDIKAGEDWEARLGGLIQSADTVVFVISPEAVQSERCDWEVKRAEGFSKRVIPVVAIDVPEEQTPPGLRRLNYIFFGQGHSYAKGLGDLATALRVDLNWIREHTRLGELAARWRERKTDALLLRESELESARTWLAGWKAPAPEPTEAHRAFIGQSEAAEREAQSAERQRLAAVAEEQAAKERQLTMLRRRAGQFFIFSALMLGIVIASTVALYFAFDQVEAAEERIQIADQRVAELETDLLEAAEQLQRQEQAAVRNAQAEAELDRIRRELLVRQQARGPIPSSGPRRGGQTVD